MIAAYLLAKLFQPNHDCEVQRIGVAVRRHLLQGLAHQGCRASKSVARFSWHGFNGAWARIEQKGLPALRRRYPCNPESLFRRQRRQLISD
jgi:hypothetical protein